MERILKVKLLTENPLPNKTTFVLGATGSGKSVLTATLLSSFPRYIIFDIKNDYFHVPFVDGVRCNDYFEFTEALNNAEPRIIFDPLQKYSSHIETVLEEMVWHLIRFQEQNIGTIGTVRFVLDELNRFVDSRRIPPAGLKEAVERGRAYGIEKLFCGQWFGTVNTGFRDSFSEMYIFAHYDRAALNLFSEYGLDADEIRNLPEHVCLHYDKKSVSTIRCVAEPQTKKEKQYASAQSMDCNDRDNDSFHGSRPSGTVADNVCP